MSDELKTMLFGVFLVLLAQMVAQVTIVPA